MKQIFVIAFFFFSITGIWAQENDEKGIWTTKGNFKFLFNQSAFSNWVARGDNNLAASAGINYDFNYKKNGYTWNNKILASYGLTKSKNTEFEKKTDDRFEYNTLMGWKAKNYW